MNLPHQLRGTFHASDAAEVEDRAEQAARDYFGDIPVIVEVSVREMRDVGDHVLTYEVDYTAAPDPDRQTAPR